MIKEAVNNQYVNIQNCRENKGRDGFIANSISKNVCGAIWTGGGEKKKKPEGPAFQAKSAFSRPTRPYLVNAGVI